MQEKDYGSGIKSYSMSGDDALKFLDNYGKGIGARDLVNEGATLFLAGKYDEAEIKFKEAIAQNPNNAVAHANIGNIYFKRKQFKSAISWLEKALSLDPKIAGVTECLNECRKHNIGASSVKTIKDQPNEKTKKWWEFWK
jgi:tetratricopeptide (TPR) repeat protein